MRLLMFGPGLDVRGGMTSVAKVILAGLPENVHVQHVATMVEGGKAIKVWTFFKAMLQLEIALLKGVDVVHIHLSSRASVIRKEIVARRAMMAGRNVVMHAHGSEYRLYWNALTEAQKRRRLRVLKRVSVLIVLGEIWRDFFVSIGVPSERIAVLPNPVSVPDTTPNRDNRERITFAFLGVIGKRKGAFDLLEAICSLPQKKREQCHFVLAGNGEVSRLRLLAETSKVSEVVTVYDWLDEPTRDQLLAEADVFILPSYNEGLPMALLEAMAWGLPPICTPVGSIPEIIRDGQNGILVPQGDIAAIAAAIERLACNKSERLMLGASARSTVIPLSTQRYISRLCALYKSLP